MEKKENFILKVDKRTQYFKKERQKIRDDDSRRYGYPSKGIKYLEIPRKCDGKRCVGRYQQRLCI